jgi:hypothetical protein
MKKYIFSMMIFCCAATVSQAQSVLTSRTFINDFNGETINDNNQTTAGGSSQSDGSLTISTGGMSGYRDFFTVSFAAPLDFSENAADRKIKLDYDVTGINGSVRIQLHNAAGQKKIYSKNFTAGHYDEVFGMSGVWYEPNSTPFDWSQITMFRLASDANSLEAGTIKLNFLQIGSDLPTKVDLTYDSFSQAAGLTVAVVPAVHHVSGFEFYATETNAKVQGITVTELEDGAKYNFKGLDINKTYRLKLNDANCYSDYIYAVSSTEIIAFYPYNTVFPTVNWNKIVAQLTADHWGVNDMGAGMASVNTNMADFFSKVNPGVVRRHNASLINSWIDRENKQWKTAVIKQCLDNSKDTYKHCGRIMLCADHLPAFIGTNPFALTEEQRQEVAAFYARLPEIISNLGYHIDMFEFFNENVPEGLWNTTDLSSYWDLLNKIALAVKQADPTVKTGGSAESWSWSQTYRGFIDNCPNMDFVSYHIYTGVSSDANGRLYSPTFGSNAAAAASYLKSIGKTHIESFLDEFNLPVSGYVCERSHIGAAWIACAMKDVAMKGLTGMNYWNTEDVNMGLNYNTAVANLYSLSRNHLRGGIAETANFTERVELIPVLASNGRKSILFVNRVNEPTTVFGAKALLGENVTNITGLLLDESTKENHNAYNSNSPAYKVDTLTAVPSTIVLNPYGMMILTSDLDEDIVTEEFIKISPVHNPDISPNPFSNSVSISQAEGGVLKIYNVSGQLIETRNIKSAGETVPTAHLPKGLYLFVLEKDNVRQAVKGVKN